MKLVALLGKGLLATSVGAAGFVTGNVTRDVVHRSASPATAYPTATATPQPATNGPAPATTDSLLHYKFQPGTRDYYRLQADIRGTGIESLASATGILMGFSGDMQVHTESVDSEGNGHLDIRFDQVQMRGDFMGELVELSHSLAGTEYHHGNENISTAAGDSTASIPQLQFLNTPVKATVSPAGDVLQVSGAPGFDQMIAPEALLAAVQFPAGDLDAGLQWTSEFGMPVPGFGSLVSSEAVNTLEGFDLFRGRYCAIIRQTLTATQQDGQVQLPESALGEGMNLSVPAFNLTGENRIYFDVEGGKLVQADLNVHFTMRVGEELKAVTQLLDTYGQLLNELDGQPGAQQKSDDLVNLGVNILGSLSLADQ